MHEEFSQINFLIGTREKETLRKIAVTKQLNLSAFLRLVCLDTIRKATVETSLY